MLTNSSPTPLADEFEEYLRTYTETMEDLRNEHERMGGTDRDHPRPDSGLDCS